MNRREFIGLATAAVLAAALPLTGHAKPVRVWCVSDNEEQHWIAATSKEDAHDCWREMFGQWDDERQIISSHPLPDDELLPVGDAGPRGETVTKTAGEWAKESIERGYNAGLVATTEGI